MTSLDTEGRGILGPERPKKPVPTETLGVSGTAIYSGFIQEIEKDSRLRGREKYKTFSDNLANVTVIGAGVRFFLNLVAKAAWKVEPPEDSGTKGEELAEVVQGMLDDMDTPWHRVVRRAAMYRFYGFSIQEWTAKRRDDGLIGLLDVESRPQITVERWDTDRNSKVLGVIQRSPQTQEEIPLPREKLVYLVDDSLNDSPEGLGLFRHLVESAARLQRYEQLEGFGFEGDLRGIPIGKAPLTELDEAVKRGEITLEKANEMLLGITKFLQNHIKNPQLSMLLDSKPYVTTDEKQAPSTTSQWDMSILDGGDYSLEEMAAAIIRVNLDMARVLGVEHLLLGADGKGSLALSRDKSNNFALIVDSTLKELREQFEKDILGPLWDLNGWDPDLKPQLKTETITYRDVEQVSAVLRDLATTGVILDRQDDAVQEVVDLLGLSRLKPLSEIDPDMQLVGGPVPDGGPDEGGEPQAPPTGTEEDMPGEGEDD